MYLIKVNGIWSLEIIPLRNNAIVRASLKSTDIFMWTGVTRSLFNEKIRIFRMAKNMRQLVSSKEYNYICGFCVYF
jgi:hypothetical protein